MRSLTNYLYLMKEKSEVGVSEVISCSSSDVISIQIYGNATEFEVEFQGSILPDEVDKWVSMSGYCVSDCSEYITSITDLDRIISFDVSNILRVRCVLKSITTGEISIYSVSGRE